ncbi:hypothetical protein ACOME3_007918 [Neoechinorhynchus agilis]
MISKIIFPNVRQLSRVRGMAHVVPKPPPRKTMTTKEIWKQYANVAFVSSLMGVYLLYEMSLLNRHHDIFRNRSNMFGKKSKELW